MTRPAAPPASFRTGRTYSLHGYRLCARWPDEAVADVGARILDYHGCIPVASGAADAPAWQFRVRRVRTVPPPPADADPVAAHASGLRILKQAGDLYLCLEGVIVRVDAAAGRVEASLAEAHDPTTRLGLYFALTFSLLALLQAEGLYAVHGAALCRHDGTGLLLVADSDSGKSTTAMQLVRSGWHYLSDDSFFLRRADGALEALPFRRDFGLDPDAAEAFPEIETVRDVQLTDAAKWRVPIDRIYPGQRAERCRPRVLVLPTIADAATSRVEPVTAAEALVHVMPQCSFLDPDRAADQLGVLSGLVAQARPYRLLAGRDALADPARVPALLATLLHA